MSIKERAESQRIEAVAQEEGRVVSILLVLMGAFSVNTQQLFTYKSGKKGPVYLDNRLIMSRPIYWERITGILARRVVEHVGIENVDVLNCVATGGLIQGSRVADGLRLPLAWVDHEASLVEGARIVPGQRVVIIEDHLSSGESVLDDVGILRRAGAHVEWCLSVSTYDHQQVGERLRAEGINFLPICDLDSLLDASLKASRITPEDMRQVQAWVRDPEAWTTNHISVSL